MKKKSFGPQTFLYPMPTVIVGAMVEGRPNFNTIACAGIAQSKPPMIAVSMDKGRFTHGGIMTNKAFSVNIPSEEMVVVTDYIGFRSGSTVDKSDLFTVFYGKLGNAPMIEECPVNMRCELVTVTDFGGKNDLLVGKITESYAEEKYCTGGYPDIQKVKPFVFTWHDLNYWKIGENLGRTLSVGKTYDSR